MQISSTVYVLGFADLMLKVITMKNLELIAFVLLLIGGINWGLVGMFNYNVVTSLLGDGTTMTKVVYGMVGLGALYEAVKFFRSKSARLHPKHRHQQITGNKNLDAVLIEHTLETRNLLRVCSRPAHLKNRCDRISVRM